MREGPVSELSSADSGALGDRCWFGGPVRARQFVVPLKYRYRSTPKSRTLTKIVEPDAWQCCGHGFRSFDDYRLHVLPHTGGIK